MSKDDEFHKAVEAAIQQVANDHPGGGGTLEDFYVQFRHSETLTSTMASKRVRGVLDDLRRLSCEL